MDTQIEYSCVHSKIGKPSIIKLLLVGDVDKINELDIYLRQTFTLKSEEWDNLDKIKETNFKLI